VISAAGGPGPGPVDAVVVAAGSSWRMAGRDKLVAEIAGRTLLAWTLDRLAAAQEIARIVVVTRPAQVAALRSATWLPPIVVDVVAGGTRRQESVAAGVDRLGREPGGSDPERILLIHDGARPLVTPGLVAAVVAATAETGAAIPVLALADTVKRVEAGRVAETLDRTILGTAQTPQGIRRGLLEQAWASYPPDGPRTFTDEAGLLEACTITVHAIAGDPMNFKVTVPGDLERAAAVLAPGRPVGGEGVRVGFGTDRHPFGPGEPLLLAGVVIEGMARLQGHSDGDVALHALADALLGAAGLGDLGRQFPAGPETPAGLSSTIMLKAVVDQVRSAGYRPASLDLTIVAGRPHLGPSLRPMARAIADAVGLALDRVNVKASSGNLEGWEGAGRGISASAVAVIQPISSEVVPAGSARTEP
jgi:2-C-methyl-D-erythritol 4-phosphate cytidylyltransferase / 2-C-methyl-D-erythritol 2,4-cyclodiphosphate synthase